MDPVAGLSKKKDSTLAMCLAAQARGWTVYSITQDGLYFAEGQVLALATLLEDPAFNPFIGDLPSHG